MIKLIVEIKFYFVLVHRIGRTGRSGQKGFSTTFINKMNDESVLLDLKHLLIEAKQKVPHFLATMQSENEKYLEVGGEKKNSMTQIVVLILVFLKKKCLKICVHCYFRRKRLQLLWWSRSQDHGLSQVGSGTKQASFKYWKKRLSCKQRNRLLIFCFISYL